jgi:plasmid stabilization system protein ParE
VTRFEVEFSPKALASLGEIARYIAQDAGAGRASDWLGKIQKSTVTLETHPQAFPRVGLHEGEDIHARFILRHALYYFVDEDAPTSSPSSTSFTPLENPSAKATRTNPEDRPESSPNNERVPLGPSWPDLGSWILGPRFHRERGAKVPGPSPTAAPP